ncbi:MAG: ergothioneine biosynthesis protein EgtB [Potamolinea sp.]
MSTSINFRREAIRDAMDRCRLGTLALFEGIGDTSFRKQAHPEFSPPGWHLGHIGYTEALWILERCGGFPPLFPENRKLWAADGLPKCDRQKLPPVTEICDYLETIRSKVFYYLETAPLDKEELLWRFLLQHESQHCEIISFVLQLQGWQVGKQKSNVANPPSSFYHPREMVEIPAGEFEMGNDSIDALDNERSLFRLYLDTYWIDRYPVTCKEYRKFIEAGGYQNPELWLDAGWQWLQETSAQAPLYWSNDVTWDNHPVCGVSWYEADAYARFVGKRLPTEAEWEKAASWDSSAGRRNIYPWGDAEPDKDRCNHNNIAGQTTPVNLYPEGQSAYGCYDLLGNVWEWTSSWFEAYKGFESYPYRGYSQVYFDGKHRVLKGASWATRPWAMRSSFRNWYYPEIRQILAGFRCVRDLDRP